MVSDLATRDAILQAAEYFCMVRLTELINEWSSCAEKVEVCNRCLLGFKWCKNTRDSCQGVRVRVPHLTAGTVQNVPITSRFVFAARAVGAGDVQNANVTSFQRGGRVMSGRADK